MQTRKTWTESHVKAIAEALPELFTISEPGQRARLISQHQLDILGERFVRTRDSIHMSLYPKGKLHRMLEALRPKEPNIMTPPPDESVPAPAPQPAPEFKPRPVVRLLMREWTALAHHPQVSPLLDTRTFCTPNQLIGVLERAQRDVLPEDRWRNDNQWHSAIYRKTRVAGKKRDALSMLREGIKYQPLPHYVVKTAPAPVVPEPVAPTEETKTVNPSLFISGNDADTGLVQAVLTLFKALQDRTVGAVAPILERLERMEKQLAALPKDVRTQVADCVGDSAPPLPEGVIVHDEVARRDDPMRMPRVDVVGLLNGQVDVVKRACGHQWNLRFLTADEVRSQPITAPDAIMLRRFVSHSAQERIKKAGATLHFANGAAESVIAQLNKLGAARLN